jgi:hypothetical protein
MTTAVPLCTALYKLGTFITGTILTNTKYLQQHSGTDFKLEKKTFRERFSACISHVGKEISERSSFVTVYNSKAED